MLDADMPLGSGIRSKRKDMLVFFVMILVISASFVLYYNHKVKLINAEYTGQLTGIQNEMRERNDRVAYELKKLEESVNTRTKTIETELKKSNNALSKDLSKQIAGMQQESKKEILDISGKLTQMESDKESQFTEMEDKIKTISVKNEDFSFAVGDAVNSVVSVETFGGKASGTVFKSTSSGSYIVTSLHVLDPSSNVGSVAVIETSSGIRETAGIVGINEAYDLAVLKVKTKLDPLTFGDSRNINVGEKVFALGNPGGIGISVTEGIISATKRYAGNIPYIQTDSSINEGNSGGPLINARGEMIGLNTLKVMGYEGIGLATPSYIVESISKNIVAKEK